MLLVYFEKSQIDLFLGFFSGTWLAAPEEDHHRVIAAALRPPSDWRRFPGRTRSTWLRVIDEDVQPPKFWGQPQNFGGPHGLEEGKGQGCLLGVRH